MSANLRTIWLHELCLRFILHFINNKNPTNKTSLITAIHFNSDSYKLLKIITTILLIDFSERKQHSRRYLASLELRRRLAPNEQAPRKLFHLFAVDGWFSTEQCQKPRIIHELNQRLRDLRPQSTNKHISTGVKDNRNTKYMYTVEQKKLHGFSFAITLSNRFISK